jgi:hypothetical protein
VSQENKSIAADELSPTATKRSSLWLPIVLTAIPVIGTVAVAWMRPTRPEPSAVPVPPPAVVVAPARAIAPEQAQASFNQFDRALSRYLSAADDFGSTFARRGRAAFTSAVAEQEIDNLGRQLSAAFHEINESAPRYLRDLQAALPGRVTFIQDANDLLNSVLRDIHTNAVRPINVVIDAINDSDGKRLRDNAINDHLVQVVTNAAVIQKQCQQATEQLNNLRRAFGTIIAEPRAGR